MVEASLVFPLLILSVITCLLISMFFYETTLRQCLLHRQLRCAADNLTGCTCNLSADQSGQENPSGEYALSTSRSGVFHTVSGKEHTEMIHQGILHQKVSEDLESLWHASDGVSYVRYCNLIHKQGSSNDSTK